MDGFGSILERIGDRLTDLPAVAAPIAALIFAICLALLLHRIVFDLLLRWRKGKVDLSSGLVRKARRPLRLVFVLIAFFIVAAAVRLPYEIDVTLQRVVLILIIVVIGWTAIILTNYFADRSLARRKLNVEDNLAARKYVTQVRVLRRTASIVIGILTVGAALLTFESVRSYGVSLLASAGAAGLILGLAARPVLANLIAGIQIALTQPIRLEDVVIVEGEWGWIEEIFATYVVVRIWDWRRMVVPLSYFIEKPFQNWTRESASIIGAVFWYVDYTLPVDRMRAKLTDFVQKSPYWDGQVVNLQVTETDKDTMTIRGLMSARNSPQAWDLRCEIRERMLAWLQAEFPDSLPRLRGEMELRGEGKMPTRPDIAPPAGAGSGENPAS